MPVVSTLPAGGYGYTSPVSYAGTSTFGTTRIAAPISVGTSTLAPRATVSASPAMTVAAPKTFQVPQPATIVAAPVTVQAPVMSTLLSPTPASVTMSPVTTLPSSPSAYYQYVTPPSYQTLPTVSSAIVAPAQVKAKGTGEALRLTIVPIKDGAEESLTTFLNGKEVAVGVNGLAGLNFVQAFFVDDKMIVAAMYNSMEDMGAGTAVNQTLLGKVADQFAGAPTRYASEVAWSFKGPGKISGPIATRVTVCPLKPGSEQPVWAMISDIEAKMKDPAFDECIDIQDFFLEDKLVIVARYSSTNGMEKVSAKIQEIMAPLAPYLAGAPERFMGTTAWSVASPTKKKKAATKAKKRCC